MKPTCPVSIDTLGKLIDYGIGAFMVCPTCAKAGRSDVRDIDRLAGHLGRNWCFIKRRWLVKCATCGERSVEVWITPSVRTIWLALSLICS